MSSYLHKTLKFSIVYGIGTLLNRSVSFIMLPIYTRYLSPTDYGILELLGLLTDIFSIIIGLRIGHTISRFYYRSDDEQSRREIVSSIFILSILLSTMAAVSVFIPSTFFSGLLFDSAKYSYYVKIAALLMLFSSVVSVPMIFIQTIQRPALFVGLSTLKLLLQLGLNVYFLVFLGYKVLGVLYSGIIANFVMSIFLIPFIFKKVGFCLSKKHLITVVLFSAPLAFASLGTFYIKFADRYFIKFWSNLEEVGLYSLGFKFAAVYGLLIASFARTWNVQAFEVFKKTNADEIFDKVFEIFTWLSLVIAVPIAIIGPEILRIMAAPEFHDAHRVIPILLLANLFQNWAWFFRFSILYEGKTYLITIGSLLAAVVISLSCYILIPSMGYIGAAYSALAAMVLRFLWTLTCSRICRPIQVRWNYPMLLMVIGIVCFGISQTLSIESILHSMVVKIAIIGTFVILSLFTIFSREQLIGLVTLRITPKDLIKSQFSI